MNAEIEMEQATYTDASERIRTFLTHKGYTFIENYDIDIDYKNMVVDTDIRSVDQEHVKFLVDEMLNEPSNINNLLTRTPIIGFFRQNRIRLETKVLFPGIFLVDGNHRLEAARLFNASQSEHHISLFPITFYIQSEVPLEHKLILMSMAEEQVYQNKKPLNKWEIMKHTRFLLLKCPSALGVEPVPKNPNTKEQRNYGEKVVKAAIKFFHVFHPSLVLRNIWKATRISDEDFDKMYKHFHNLPSGFDVHDIDVLFNKYLLCPKRVTLLIINSCDSPNSIINISLNDLKNCLRNIKPEFIPSLKYYESYNLDWDDCDHLKFIAGEEYLNKHGREHTEFKLENFLSNKKRNLRRFKGFKEKLNYLKRNFQEWLKHKDQKKKPNKVLKKANNSNADSNNVVLAESINQQAEEIPSQNVIDNFIYQLIHSNRESLAAFAVHYFLRPQNPEEPLPEFYFKYLKDDKLDFSKFPRDDGLIVDDESVNFENFTHHTFFEEANENNKTKDRKRKRKLHAQDGPSKKTNGTTS